VPNRVRCSGSPRRPAPDDYVPPMCSAKRDDLNVCGTYAVAPAGAGGWRCRRYGPTTDSASSGWSTKSRRRRQDQLIRSKMPTMKHVMTMALIATAMLAAPAGHADPDPHKPDLGANYCPGGRTADPSSPAPTCDGVPYPDGSYWHAIQRGTTSSFVVVQCLKQGTWPQPPVALPAPPGSCQ
jgi:hypothetical protein